MAGESRILLERGSLWEAVVRRSQSAAAMGVLDRIRTRAEVVEQNGVPFVIRVVDSLERKRRVALMQRQAAANPFLPYERDLFVADVTETHVCLLNKFNVMDHHILVVTREYEDQESPLTLADFTAMWVCLAEHDGVAFYNAGVVAGASQPHKHLQQVPVPLGAGPERTPMDRVLETGPWEGRTGKVPQLPFEHAATRLTGLSEMTPAEAAGETLVVCQDLLRSVGHDRNPGPYNLLVTRDWMVLVPRRMETFESISVNALGFAGSLLVRNEAELETVRSVGPMKVLEHVGISRR